MVTGDAGGGLGELFLNIRSKFNPQGVKAAEKGIKRTKNSVDGMQKAMNRLFSITAAYFALRIGRRMVAGINDTAIELDRVRTQFQVITESQQLSNELMADSTRLMQTYGVDLNLVRSGMAEWLSSTRGTNLGLEEARTLFEQITSAVGGMRLPLQEAESVMRAFTVSASRGKIQAQELYRVIAPRLPRSKALFAEALFPEIADLDERQSRMEEALRLGEVTMKQAPALVGALHKAFGMQAKNIRDSLIAQQNIMRGQFTLFQEAILGAGLNEAMVDLAVTIADLVKSKDFINFADVLGTQLGIALKGISGLVGNLKEVFDIIKLIGGTLIVRYFLAGRIFTLLGNAIIGAGSFVGALAAIKKGVISLGVAFNIAFWKFAVALGLFLLLEQGLKLLWKATKWVQDAWQELLWLWEGIPLDRIDGGLTDIIKKFNITQETIDGVIESVKNLMQWLSSLSKMKTWKTGIESFRNFAKTHSMGDMLDMIPGINMPQQTLLNRRAESGSSPVNITQENIITLRDAEEAGSFTKEQSMSALELAKRQAIYGY